MESLSCKLVYQYILSLKASSLHCVAKFLPIYGSLYWSSTWKQLFLMPLDRKVIDLNWNVCYGVLYTAARLSSFGYNHSTTCFCGFRTETSEHLFSCLSPCSQCSGLDPISPLQGFSFCWSFGCPTSIIWFFAWWDAYCSTSVCLSSSCVQVLNLDSVQWLPILICPS